MIIALGMVGSAAAQTTGTMSQSGVPQEIIAISSQMGDNYNVDQIMVLESTPSSEEFAVHYKINLTNLISTYSNNSAEIAGLRNFISSLQSDSLKRITSYDIVGYASPDGPVSLNKKLATERANDFCQFVDKECNMAEYERTVTSKPLTWSDARAAITASNVPNKSEVLSILSSTTSQAEIGAKLKAHGDVWNYIKANILPPMRYVEISVNYNTWSLVEGATIIEDMTPQTEPMGVVGFVPASNTTEVVYATESYATRGEERRAERRAERSEQSNGYEQPTDDYIYCMLVEMPGQELDYDDVIERDKLKVGRNRVKYKDMTDDEKTKVKERMQRY
ncbi:MAG: hypothetical protein SNG57_00250 [Rikenellaceae bacterium]